MKKCLILLLSGLFISCLVSAQDADFECGKAINTLEINQCALIKLVAAQDELDRYFKKSFIHLSDDPELVKSIEIAQSDWKAYLSSHCDSVYMQWRGGTIRGVMAIACKTKLTKIRTHEIWENFLTYKDSTPPILQEPKP